MINKVLIDENKKYRFDFSKVEEVWEIHEISNKIFLSDVDFIAKTEKEILFIESSVLIIQYFQYDYYPDFLFFALKSQWKYILLFEEYPCIIFL
ncbi:hypothetical protein CLTEP_22840 [Clostridium tepidiprofundi DSM 19306]|uniref:Uncharacterized protein n=1 Tax=Clostridium tepidiprofundi DSM 19306 TaxID=1121338 RepID=A0A151AWY6_9CLOT|nr:hypothetical protein CLTEP_22840 [Clostridium tepidiprofundi DSM 19306]